MQRSFEHVTVQASRGRRDDGHPGQAFAARRARLGILLRRGRSDRGWIGLRVAWCRTGPEPAAGRAYSGRGKDRRAPVPDALLACLGRAHTHYRRHAIPRREAPDGAIGKPSGSQVEPIAVRAGAEHVAARGPSQLDRARAHARRGTERAASRRGGWPARAPVRSAGAGAYKSVGLSRVQQPRRARCRGADGGPSSLPYVRREPRWSCNARPDG